MMVSRGIRSSVVVTAAASAAFIAFGVPASAQPGSADILPPGFPCIHTNVYPLPLLDWGWGPMDGVAPRFAAATGASGLGYLDMYAPPGGRTNFFHPGINTPLNQLAAPQTALSFVHQGQYVSFQLRIRGADRPGDLSGFTTLVWWPPANGGAGQTGWTPTNLKQGQWWSTNAIGGLAGGQQATATLAEISSNNPLAFVTEYGVYNDSGTGGADDITYGCARWDFEPAPSGSG